MRKHDKRVHKGMNARWGRVCNPSGWIYNNNVTDWPWDALTRCTCKMWWCATHLNEKNLFFLFFVRSVQVPILNRLEGEDAPLTCRNCRIPPLIRNESAAMPAIPSPGSRSCRKEAALGAVAVCNGQQHPEQQHADASGCELCRIMRALGDVVTRTGGGGAWQGQQWWPLFTLSLEHTGVACVIDWARLILDRYNIRLKSNRWQSHAAIFLVKVDLWKQIVFFVWKIFIFYFFIEYSLIVLYFEIIAIEILLLLLFFLSSSEDYCSFITFDWD